MDEGDWHWAVRDVFTIEGRGVVVLGPLVGSFPSVRARAVIEHDGQRVEAEVGGIEIMHVIGEPPRDLPMWSDHPVGLLLVGVSKAEVPIGATVRGVADAP